MPGPKFDVRAYAQRMHEDHCLYCGKACVEGDLMCAAHRADFDKSLDPYAAPVRAFFNRIDAEAVRRKAG